MGEAFLVIATRGILPNGRHLPSGKVTYSWNSTQSLCWSGVDSNSVKPRDCRTVVLPFGNSRFAKIWEKLAPGEGFLPFGKGKGIAGRFFIYMYKNLKEESTCTLFLYKYST